MCICLGFLTKQLVPTFFLSFVNEDPYLDLKELISTNGTIKEVLEVAYDYIRWHDELMIV